MPSKLPLTAPSGSSESSKWPVIFNPAVRKSSLTGMLPSPAWPLSNRLVQPKRETESKPLPSAQKAALFPIATPVSAARRDCRFILQYLACVLMGHARCGNLGMAGKLTGMKMAKAIRQQAATAERVAVNTADAVVANQMRTLAQAFKIQAEIIKKNKKKKKK